MRTWRVGSLLLLWGMLCANAWAGLAEVVAASKPSIVAVGSYHALDSPRFSFRGTGFVVADGNLVVTNLHVLPGKTELKPDARLMVVLPRARDERDSRGATLVASDAAHDLALLRIDGEPLPALAIGDSATVREGQAVALIGFPLGGRLGFAPVTHRGIVAAITAVALPAPNSRTLDVRAAARLREGPSELFQLDATAYPGNSGSPLLDAETGVVLGVVNMVALKGTKESALSQPSGISYAIPARRVLELLKDR